MNCITYCTSDGVAWSDTVLALVTAHPRNKVLCCWEWLQPWERTRRNSHLVYGTAAHLVWCVAGLTAGACNALLRSLLLCACGAMQEPPVHGCSTSGSPVTHQRVFVLIQPPRWCTCMFPASALLWDEPASTLSCRPALWIPSWAWMSQSRNAWVPPLLLSSDCCGAKNTLQRRKGVCFLCEGARLSFRPALRAVNAATYLLKRFLRSWLCWTARISSLPLLW